MSTRARASKRKIVRTEHEKASEKCEESVFSLALCLSYSKKGKGREKKNQFQYYLRLCICSLDEVKQKLEEQDEHAWLALLFLPSFCVLRRWQKLFRSDLLSGIDRFDDQLEFFNSQIWDLIDWVVKSINPSERLVFLFRSLDGYILERFDIFSILVDRLFSRSRRLPMVKYIYMKRITQIFASVLFVITVLTIYFAFDFVINQAAGSRNPGQRRGSHGHGHFHPPDQIKISRKRSTPNMSPAGRSIEDNNVFKSREMNQTNLNGGHRVRNVKAPGSSVVRAKPNNFHKGKTGIKVNHPQRPVKDHGKHLPVTARVPPQAERKNI